MTEAYGQRLGEALRVENAPAIVTRALRTADMAVTEIRCDNPLPGMNGPIRQGDAFFVAFYFRDSPNLGCWGGSRPGSVGGQRDCGKKIQYPKRGSARL